MPCMCKTCQKEVILLVVLTLSLISFLETAFLIQNSKSQRHYKVHPFPFKETPTKLAREVWRLANRQGLQRSTNQKLKRKEAGRTSARERWFLWNTSMNVPPKLRFKRTLSSFLNFKNIQWVIWKMVCILWGVSVWYFSCIHKNKPPKAYEIHWLRRERLRSTVDQMGLVPNGGNNIQTATLQNLSAAL